MLSRDVILNRLLPYTLIATLLVASAFVYLASQTASPVQAGWYNASWTYRKPITIDHSKVSNVATSTYSNFPVEISVTDPQLATVSNGGLVASSTGADILFTDSNGTTLLNYEIESYASTTGALVAWATIPTLTSTSDYTIYEYFGNASASANTSGNIQGTWDSNYKAVYHMADNAASTTVKDSTSNGFNGTAQANTNTKTTTGQIDGGLTFNGSSDYVAVGTGANSLSAPYTIEEWFNTSNIATANQDFFGSRGSSDNSFDAKIASSTTIHADIGTGAAWLSTAADANVTAMASNVWYHVVYAVTGSGYTIYQNGVQVGTGSLAGTALLYNSTHSLQVGHGGSSLVTEFFGGSLDEFRVSSIARSADWIATEYKNQNSPSTFYAYGNLGVQNRAANTAGVAISSRSNGISWYNSSWTYRKPITIDHSKVNSTNVVAFSVATSTATWTVPAGLTSITVKAWGGGGAAGAGDNGGGSGIGGNGGGGGFAQATLTVTPGTTLTVHVGGGGASTSSSGGGGGYSAVVNGSTYLVQAGGGGGGGTVATGNSNAGAGGPGGGSSGGGGSAGGAGGGVGGGGTQSTGGSAGDTGATVGSANQGGTGSSGGGAGVGGTNGGGTGGNGTNSGGGGGGGGGGQFGGGGGGSGTSFGFPGNGGGGGSDLVTGSGTVQTAGSGTTPGNNTDTAYTGSAGVGATGTNGTGSGGNAGLVVISYTGLSNFPVEISVTDPQLKTLTNGGLVASSTGADILFTDSNGSSLLNYEIESYASTTGTLVAWAKIPTLTATSDYTIYEYFGNASAAAESAGNITGTWDSNYKAVYHLGDNKANTTVAESTSDAYTGTNQANTNTKTVTGQIDGALTYNGSTDYTTNSAAAIGNTAVTVSAWVQNISDTENTFNNASYPGSAIFSTRDASSDASPTLAFTPYVSGTGAVGTLGVAFLADTNGTGAGAKGSTAISTGSATWYYIVGTFNNDGTATYGGKWNVYVNGVQDNASANNFIVSGSGSFGSGFTGSTWNMARDPQWAGTSNVKLDELRVSNIARSADWIKTEYNNQSSPSTFYSYGPLQINGRQNSSGTPVAAVAVSSRGSGVSWYNSSWTYRKPITIDHTKISNVATSTYSNFPVEISVTDPQLKTVTNGGLVASSTGADILFTDSNGTTLLNYEIESYASTTGNLVAWAKIPTLTAASDYTIYEYFGNSTAAANTSGNIQGTWDSNYGSEQESDRQTD